MYPLSRRRENTNIPLTKWLPGGKAGNQLPLPWPQCKQLFLSRCTLLPCFPGVTSCSSSFTACKQKKGAMVLTCRARRILYDPPPFEHRLLSFFSGGLFVCVTPVRSLWSSPAFIGRQTTQTGKTWSRDVTGSNHRCLCLLRSL